MQQLCRLWKFEGQDTLSDCKQAIEMIKGDMSKLPIQVHARILQPHEFISDANIADNEQIVLEWRININLEPDKPWAFDPKNEKRKRTNKNSRLPQAIQEIEDEEERMALPLMELFESGERFRGGLTGL